MPAIVRQTMSRNLARELLSDILLSDTNRYYIGIGKSDVFNSTDEVIPPVDSPLEEREFRNNLQSIKRVEGATMVARRYNWSSGTLYSAWSDDISSDSQYPFYVLNDAKEVYICLSQGISEDGSLNVSTIEPNYGVLGVDYLKPFTTGDGYTWKFIFSLTPETIFQYLSSNYIPVHTPESSLAVGDPIEDLQFNVKQAAVGGEIIRCDINSGGSGYTSAPAITIEGDGTGATAVAHITSGVVTKITMTNYGSGYTHATVVIQGDGTGAKCRAVITDKQGIGFDAINDLKTSSVMINIKPNGEEDGEFFVENEFRQIGVIKNPINPEGIEFVGLKTKCLPTLTLQDSSPFSSGKYITGIQSGAVAYVNHSENNIIYYHQNENTGFLQFQVGEAVTQSGVVVTGTVQSVSKINGIDRFTGDVLYIENRYRIRRDAEQQEDIKVVITI